MSFSRRLGNYTNDWKKLARALTASAIPLPMLRSRLAAVAGCVSMKKIMNRSTIQATIFLMVTLGLLLSRGRPAATLIRPIMVDRCSSCGQARRAVAATSVSRVNGPKVIPCVGALVYDRRARLLLIRRANEPGRGLWSLPGGRVESEETLNEAVVREVLEETGLLVSPGSIVGTVERGGPDGVVYAITDFAARPVSGRLQAGDDASDARFVFAAELADLPLSPGLYETLREWHALPSGDGH